VPHISQGSVETCLRCSEISNDKFSTNLLLSKKLKEFSSRSASGEVTGTCLTHGTGQWLFSVPPCIAKSNQVSKRCDTSVSASMKTHLEYCVRRQHWSLVNVCPSSGRPRSSRLAASWLSRMSTWTTASNAYSSWSLTTNRVHVK